MSTSIEKLAKIKGAGVRFVVRLVYSDESGNNNEAPFLTFGAVVLEATRQLPRVLKSIEDVRLAHPRFAIDGVEFKGNRLFGQIERAENQEIISSLLGIIFDNRIPIFCGVVRADGEEPESRQAMATARCALKVDAYLEQIGDEALWIADNNSKAEKHVQDALRMLRKIGILPGAQEFRLRNLLDTIYSGNSKESSLLQIADLSVYIIGAKIRGKKGIEPYYSVIEPFIFGDLNPI